MTQPFLATWAEPKGDAATHPNIVQAIRVKAYARRAADAVARGIVSGVATRTANGVPADRLVVILQGWGEGADYEALLTGERPEQTEWWARRTIGIAGSVMRLCLRGGLPTPGVWILDLEGRVQPQDGEPDGLGYKQLRDRILEHAFYGPLDGMLRRRLNQEGRTLTMTNWEGGDAYGHRGDVLYWPHPHVLARPCETRARGLVPIPWLALVGTRTGKGVIRGTGEMEKCYTAVAEADAPIMLLWSGSHEPLDHWDATVALANDVWGW